MSEEIIAYVQKRKDGVRYKDLTGEFENQQGWSHGKFVNHLKEANKKLEKRLIEGRPRYFVREDEETRKIAFRKDIADHSLVEASIPAERIEKAYGEYVNKLYSRYARTAGVLDSRVLRDKEMQFFREWDQRQNIKRHRDAFRISLLYPKHALPPEIPDWSYWLLLQVVEASSYADPQLTNFRIILSYDSTKVEEPLDFDTDAFAVWLKLFKGKEIDSETLKILDPEKHAHNDSEKPLSIDGLKQLSQYRALAVEYMKKHRKYLEFTTKLVKKAL